MIPAPSFTTEARIEACECLTAFGGTGDTVRALTRGTVALAPRAVLGSAGGDLVPMALIEGRSFEESAPPNWMYPLRALAAKVPGEGWGTARRPVVFTSSNFGVGSLYAFRRTGDAAHLAFGTPHTCVEWIVNQLGWGPNFTTISHACVSAHLGLLHASRLVRSGMAERVLVFSFDFLSPFVAGGFHALRILNGGFPAPYAVRPSGSIGLGDGAAFAVLGKRGGDFSIRAQSVYNEMHHFTANQADGHGFSVCLQPLRSAAGGMRLWLKGHGTGTLEAGRLEAETLARIFPDAGLVGWKGSLGHTLGSCGLVELAIACASIRGGFAPGTVGGGRPSFNGAVALEPFSTRDMDGVVCASNAFGGAHAAFLLCHD